MNIEIGDDPGYTDATLTVAGEPRPIAHLLDELAPDERDGVRRTELALG